MTSPSPQGNCPSRESIHVYYQKQMRMNMSRESSLDRISEEDSTSGSPKRRRKRGAYTMESQDSMASMASRDSISRYGAERAVGVSISTGETHILLFILFIFIRIV